MSVFWIVALLLLGAALSMLVPPLLLRAGAADAAPTPGHVNLAVLRDQLREAQADREAGTISAERLLQLRAEVEQRALEEAVPGDALPAQAAAARRTAYGLALVLPLASVLIYLALGRPDMLRAHAPAAASTAVHGTAPEQIRRMIVTLSARLEAQPDDVRGWAMLGRSYTALGRYRDAATALGRASALAPGDATLLADHADVLGMAQGKRLAGVPARLVQQALDADPRHAKALALAGSVAFEARDYAAARAYWERLLAVVPADSDLARSVRGSIVQAGALERGDPTPDAAPSAAAPAGRGAAAAEAAAMVSGQVELAPVLAARVASTDTLFVFARAVEGSRMPLAIVRRPVGPWPAAFELDDSMAVSPERRLSGQREVVIAARISRSGSATPQTGDLIGQTAVLSPGARGVRITIDRVQP